MSDAYSTAPPDEPENPSDQPAEPDQPAKKASQQEANYREGNPQRSCGLCGHFDSKGHACDVVEGEISPFGFSDRYLRQDNPFREGEKEGFKGGTKVAAVAPAAPPALRIGRKTYGGAAILVLGVVLLGVAAAQAEDRSKCIRDLYELHKDMAAARRQCDPKNHVTNPNEHGWVCTGNGPVREKGMGFKQSKDVVCE